MAVERRHKKIVFVVGAGASKEFGLPTGKELLNSISNLAKKATPLRRDGDPFQLDQSFHDAVIELARRGPEQHLDLGSRIFNLKEKAVWLSRIALLAPSIDNVLHTHKNNQDIVDLGKIMIMKCLLDAEKSSLISNRIDRGRPSGMFEFSSFRNGESTYVADSWLGELFALLVELRNFDQFLEALSFITFISFNYDRCIEQYLTSCAMVYFRLDETQARLVLENIKIIHPYGTLGKLSVFSDFVLGFGETSQDLINESKKIRTFTEQVDNIEFNEDIKDAFDSPEIVFFLGFGFLDLNLELLFRDSPFDAKRVLGTHLGMSGDSAAIIETRLIDSLMFGKDEYELRRAKLFRPMPDRVKLEDLTCMSLLRKHQMFLRA